MDGEGRNKTAFTDHVLFYVENQKESTKKNLELINSYSRVAGYEVNIQKSIALLYTSNE